MNPQQAAYSILKKLNLTNMEDGKKNEFIASIEELIAQRTINKILELAPKDQLNTFTALLEKDNSDEEIYLFGKKHIPNFDNEIKKDMEELMAKLENQQN